MKNLLLAAKKLKHRAALARNAALRVCLAPFRFLPVSSKRFGPVKGFHRDTPEFVKDRGASYRCALHPLTLEECDPGRPEPITLDAAPHWRFLRRKAFRPAARFVAVLPKGRVLEKQGYVISPDDRVLTDVSWEVGSGEPERHPLLSRLALPPCEELAGNVFVLSGYGYASYYHWLFEVLPKLALLRAAGLAADKYCVAVEQPFQRQTLNLVGVRETDWISLTDESHFEVERLVCASIPSLDGEVPRWVCQFLRDSFCTPGGRTDRRRILIVRDTPGRRAWLNQEECRPVLERFGFESVRLEDMTFEEQVRTLESAAVILAPHGAGLSNLAFAPADAKVVELFSPRYVNPCFWKLSCARGLHYSYLIGLGEMPPEGRDPHEVYADISVKPGRLEEILIKSGIHPLGAESK